MTRAGTRFGAAAEPRPSTGERGQATVEVVGLVPLLVAVAVAVFAVLAAGRASTAADAAAEAAAVAVIQGRDGEDAARRSLTGWSRDAATVTVRDGRVDVRVRPPVPILAGLLTASAQADAGRRPAPAPMFPIRGGDGASSAPTAPPSSSSTSSPSPSDPASPPVPQAPAAPTASAPTQPIPATHETTTP